MKPATNGGPALDLWQLRNAVKQRKWFLLICFLVTLVVSVLIPQGGSEKIYVSQAKVLLTPPTSTGSQDAPRDMGRWWFTDEATLKELVDSEELLRHVIAKLKLEMEWSELKDKVTLSAAGVDAPGGFRWGMSNSLFQITVESTSPEMSKKIADVVVEEFVSSIQDLSAREFANTRRFLEDLVREAKQNAEATENKLLGITTKRDTKTDERDIATQISELERQKLSLREQLAKLGAEQAAVNSYLSGGSNTPPWTLLKEDGALRSLEQTVAENRIKLVEASQYYTPDSPEVRAQADKLAQVQSLYDEQMSKASRSVVDEKGNESGALEAQLSSVESQISKLRATQLTPNERREVAKLERELNVWEENRLALVRQLYQARVVEQSSRRQGAISILQRPTLGVQPRDGHLPSLLKSLALGIPFSLVVSLGLLLLVDFVGRSLQLLPHIEETLQTPILVVVPKYPREITEEWDRVKKSLEERGRGMEEDDQSQESWKTVSRS